jgi:chorismate-pyruvate lyase
MSNGVAERLRDGAKCDKSGPLWRKFLLFHRENPWVYDRFVHHASELRQAGFRNYGAHPIIQVMRYMHDLQTKGEEVEGVGRVKLNNNHAAYYARLLIEADKAWWDFFPLRIAEGDPMPEDCLRAKVRAVLGVTP